MTEIPEGTKQGTLVHGDPCAFACFGNIVPPMIATLNLPRFIVGISVWLFTNLVFLNALDASQARILCQEHQTNLDPLHYSPIKYSPPPSFLSNESIATSSQDPRKKKRKNHKKKKKKGGKSLAFSSQAKGKQRASACKIENFRQAKYKVNLLSSYKFQEVSFRRHDPQGKLKEHLQQVGFHWSYSHEDLLLGELSQQ